MSSTGRYRAEIEQVSNNRRPGSLLFHYCVLDENSGESLFEGFASDMREAIDSVNAWIEYLQLAAAA
jgi:hypothetical protein